MWTYNQTTDVNELYHHGIAGQKWGIRRYQNKDGSLTPKGVKRYEKLKGELDALTPKKTEPASEPKPNYSPWNLNLKKASELTTKELDELNSRFAKEDNYKKYKDRVDESRKPWTKKLGEKLLKETKDVVISSVTEFAKEKAKAYLKDQLGELTTKLLKDDSTTDDKNKNKK